MRKYFLNFNIKFCGLIMTTLYISYHFILRMATNVRIFAFHLNISIGFQNLFSCLCIFCFLRIEYSKDFGIPCHPYYMYIPLKYIIYPSNHPLKHLCMQPCIYACIQASTIPGLHPFKHPSINLSTSCFQQSSPQNPSKSTPI